MRTPSPLIQAIVVPQGAEYRAVRRGLSLAKSPLPVFAIPIGVAPLSKALETLKQDLRFDLPQPQILLMGLCGSLSSEQAIGGVVLYQSCLREDWLQACDGDLTSTLSDLLKDGLKVKLVKSLTTDRVIHTAAEKRDLRTRYDADVVDMEGAIVLTSLTQAGIAVAMLRVVSDDCHHNIPNLNAAIRADGSLNAVALVTQFLREPIAAARLIGGSVRGLRSLQRVTTCLATQLDP